MSGAEGLAQFERAPASVQSDFWAAIRRHAEREHADELRREGQTEERCGHIPGYAQGLPRWDERWRTRAYNHRLREERGTRDNGFQPADSDMLKAIPAAEYVEVLVGEEPNRAGFISCPLPDHDDRTPSFHCKDTHWTCYGCGSWGSIYDLAAALWDLEVRGAHFLTVHERLMERFA